jgi:hypothetical protein
MVRHPADLGFVEPGYDLQPLRLEQITVAAEYKPTGGMLFPMSASTLGERIGVRKDTAEARVMAAVEIVTREPDEPWLIWCNLNSEADAIERLLPAALQVAGRDPVEQKITRLLGFKDGQPLHLVSKPSLAGHGMNYQHCARMAFVGSPIASSRSTRRSAAAGASGRRGRSMSISSRPSLRARLSPT